MTYLPTIWANSTCPFPHAAANCVPSLDQAMLNNDPVLGLAKAYDHYRKYNKI